jgi:hypothetical protein
LYVGIALADGRFDQSELRFVRFSKSKQVSPHPFGLHRAVEGENLDHQPDGHVIGDQRRKLRLQATAVWG